MCKIAKKNWKAGDRVKIVSRTVGELEATVIESALDKVRIEVPAWGRTVVMPMIYVSEVA